MANKLHTFLLVLAIAVPSFTAWFIYVTDFFRWFNVVGFLNQAPQSHLHLGPSDFVYIADTTHCEDLHYHEPSGLIFTACEDAKDTRYAWFPPLAFLDNAPKVMETRGSIRVIDPKSLKASKLELEGFNGPFVTHGIDVIPDPVFPEGEAVYIFAVNHLPDFEDMQLKINDGDVWNVTTHSQIEIFHHVIGSDSARHIRSVWDPLIRTPNDILAISPTSFFVTNDHFHRQGVKRAVEDFYFQANWTDTIHIELSKSGSAAESTEGVTATIALDGMHNNNGLGHGRTEDEALVTSFMSGLLHIGQISSVKAHHPSIQVRESIRLPSPIDNPSYFRDPYRTDSFDGSAFVMAGLPRIFEFAANMRNATAEHLSIVWSVKPNKDEKAKGKDKWEVKQLFVDDGSRLSTASAAVLVAIEPTDKDAPREAWLFATGFLSSNVIAVKVEL